MENNSRKRSRNNNDNTSDSSHPLPNHAPKYSQEAYIVIGNSHQKIKNEEGGHKWVLFIEGENESICPFIEKVDIKLHDTFSPNFFTLTRQPFRMTRIGWGIFNIKICIYFTKECNARNTLDVEYKLSFEGGGAKTKYLIEFERPVLITPTSVHTHNLSKEVIELDDDGIY